MSAVHPAEKIRRWSKMEDILADDEAERVARLPLEELKAEMDANGFGSAEFPSMDAILARVEELAGRRGLATGIPRVSDVRALKPRRTSWPVPVAVAVAVAIAAAIALVVWKRSAPLEAHNPPIEALPAAEAIQMRKAAALKAIGEAQHLCDTHWLGPCQDKLNEAAKDDPESEKNPAVITMRKKLYDYDHMVPPVGDPK